MLNPGQQLYRKLCQELAQTDFFKPDLGHHIRRLMLYGGLHLISFWGVFHFAHSGWRWIALLGLALSNLQFYFFAHDAGHYSLSKRKIINFLVGEFSMSFLGGGSFHFWQHKHNLHHRYCNEEKNDPDVEALFVKFYADDTTERPGWIRWIVKNQAVLVWFLAMFHNFDYLRLSWLYIAKHPKLCRREMVLAPLHFCVYFFLPAVILGWQIAVVNYLFITAVTGILLVKLFAVNHIGMPTVPPNHNLSFLEQQVITSRNVLVPRWFDDYFGGLNYQIEHHLFPWVPISRYRGASPVVKAFCQQHGIPYHEENLFSAMMGVERHLARMAATEKST
ncbi:acyl-CoA desaturase [Spirulina subsalsa FACHB-351]|uniref:Acyl-CoA desaturase n=1 Tax=Spirulina subsalsa FACHB-351 TaxID=234711 RepID=A0ABT3L6Y6_9CYAN|nr:acyl-CoA desaturase [Spirulina subsalsa]MCW6037268.1 acyl-CoA desaturase [Spirulina subsalsa FACHB-351]